MTLIVGMTPPSAPAAAAEAAEVTESTSVLLPHASLLWVEDGSSMAPADPATVAAPVDADPAAPAASTLPLSSNGDR